jgi:LacI family transcriptional regulator
MTSVVDVARLARVSTATASRVLSGSAYPVSEKTRLRVLEAAKTLHYSPSTLAKAMVTGATRIVGVIIGDATDPYFAAIVRGVEDVARQYGYLVIVCNSDRVPSIELQYLHALNGYWADGVIFAGGGLVEPAYLDEVRQALEVFQARGAACVSLGKHLFPSLPVMVDNEQVIRDAVAHLHGLGHTRLGYISGPEHLTTTHLRRRGFEAALADRGLALSADQVLPGDFTFEAGVRAADRVAGLAAPPTALVAANDIMAIGCLTRLKELGWRIPADISVMGVDDIVAARFVDPPLTTIGLPLYQLGATGMQRLVELRRSGATTGPGEILPHHLVIRGSTAEPPMGDPARRSM